MGCSTQFVTATDRDPETISGFTLDIGHYYSAKVSVGSSVFIPPHCTHSLLATPNSSKLLKLVTPPPVPRHPARLGNPRQLHDGASSPRSLVQHFDGTLTSVRATPSTRPRGRPRLHMQRYSSLPDPCANASSILCPSFRATSEELHDHPTLIALDRTHFPASPTRRSSRQMVARLYLSGSTQTHSTRTPQSCRPE